MEVALVGAFLSTFAPKLLEVLKEKREVKFRIETDIEFIKGELGLVAAVIEDLELPSRSTSTALRQLIDQARELARDTEDCILCYLYPSSARLRVGRNKEFATKISSLREKVAAVYKDLKSSSATPLATSSEPQDRHIDPSRLVGMVEPLAELLELVQLPSAPSDRKRKVISIVGFGGLGKTLLAKQFYDSAVGQQYSPRVRITAAGMCAKEILEKILFQLEPAAAGVHGTLDLEHLGERLASFLKDEKYLILIDDMRRTDQWHDIESAFPESDIMDARIIVTTTIHPVANACSSSNRYVYKLTPLDENNSEQLFLRRFPLEKHSALKVSAAEILKKCDGLPLALVSLSEFLLSGTTCEDACRKLGAYLAEEGGELRRMRRVLVNKYTSLSGHDLKACLLYFCMFPCDHPARRNSLIRRWLAEGFVGAKPGCSPQDVAVEKLKDLIDRNIIQSMEVSTNGNVKRCRPHGMMLEYICYKSMAENFATLVPPAERIRRLFLHQTNSAADHNWISGIDLSRVRTLAVSGNACEAILEFDKYTLLGVLDLKESSAVLNGKQVQDICKLMLLKYLSLGNTVVRLPRDIGKLEQLETLEMKTTEPVEVYSEVFELPKLKHLIGKFKLLDKPDRKLEKFLSESSILEMVTGFVIGKSKGFAQLMSHMGLLRQVKIWCDSMANESNLNDISKAIKKFIRHGTAMASDNRSLSIDFAECSPDFSKLVLESLQDIGGSLAALKLRGELRHFISSHDFVTKMNGVQELCLSSTKLSGVAIIEALSNLGALKYLKLVEDNLGSFTIQPDKFKSLERLCFVCVPRLDITIQAGALPLLVSLHILCEALAGVLPPGIVIGRLESLKEIALLDSGLTPAVKHGWKIAAKGHANRPDVLFIQN